ncbi:DUF3558 domain-containing protein [Halopolyspora algeriensis]|uniref:DUF3558 domain-containing protein n=1 Tax=Halopolyspora algeriensis TaxID=1500506 RepID=UPI001FE8D601|nr:DUF3558 domain-containing protein [Halopolyspora algeriensis]
MLGAGLLLTVALTACSGGSGAGTPSDQSGRQLPTTAPSGSAAPVIANPKDATAMSVCSLLSSEAATTLGLNPTGKKESKLTAPKSPDSCEWESPGSGATKVSITAFNGRSIQQYYNNSSEYSDFEKLRIAEHPAVRANKNDPMVGGSCAVFLASKENQVVMAYARLNAEDTGKVDPCGMAKKAFELSVPSWPAAQ